MSYEPYEIDPDSEPFYSDEPDWTEYAEMFAFSYPQDIDAKLAQKWLGVDKIDVTGMEFEEIGKYGKKVEANAKAA